jgi:SpoIID/LytB domain protein
MVGWRRATALLALFGALAAAQSAGAAPVLVIEGAGDGHGVGMSQVGADGLAQHGYSAAQILAHYYTGTSLERLAPGRIVTVLLQSDLRSVVFSGATRADSRPLNQASAYIATVSASGRIALESEHGRLLSYLAAPLEVTGPDPITFDGAATSGVVDGRYRGSLELDPSNGRLDVINRVGVESYLRGVVPAESPPSWPPAELEAQAIAARSYTVASPPQQPGFDVYADTRSQQYGGYDAETTATDAAVSATAGEVVTYGAKPVATYYFASSGGATESVQNVFMGATPEPYLMAVLDPYDTTSFGPITMSLQSAQRRLAGIVRGTLRSPRASCRRTWSGARGRRPSAAQRSRPHSASRAPGPVSPSPPTPPTSRPIGRARARARRTFRARSRARSCRPAVARSRRPARRGRPARPAPRRPWAQAAARGRRHRPGRPAAACSGRSDERSPAARGRHALAALPLALRAAALDQGSRRRAGRRAARHRQHDPRPRPVLRAARRRLLHWR